MTNSAPSLFDIVGHTPIWVWVVLVLVVSLGLQRISDRVVPLWRLLLLPAIMAIYALSGLAGAGIDAVPAVLVGLATGGVAGWLMERDGATRPLPGGRVWLRGEWASLLQVLAVFVFRYASAVIAATDPALAADGAYRLVSVCVSSLLAALFVGRTAARLRSFLHAPVAA
jgi:hypothetical protein